MRARSRKPPKPDSPPTLTPSALKARGWTDALIGRFLPEPDLTRPNPWYRGSPPMKFYLRSRVEQVEATEEFREAAGVASRRKAAAGRAVATKRESMRRRLDELVISVRRLGREDLIAMAIRSYNYRKEDRALRRGDDFDFQRATPESDPRFLDRITVNFVRHHLTRYDDHLEGVRGRVGADLGWPLISAKVFGAIAEAYPWLADECDRQAMARGVDVQGG